MKITQIHLKQIIRTAILSEASTGSKDSKSDQKESKTNKKFIKGNYFIGPNVTIDPVATVGGSQIGARGDLRDSDNSSIKGEKSIITYSIISDKSHVIDSDIDTATVSTECSVINSKLKEVDIHERTNIKYSTITGQKGEFHGVRYDSKVEYSTVTDSTVTKSTLTGNSNVQGCQISSSKLAGVTITRDYSGNLGYDELKKFTIDSTEASGAEIFYRGGINYMSISAAKISFATIIDSSVRGFQTGIKINGVKGAAPYLENARIDDNAELSGNVEIIGLISKNGGIQQAVVSGNAKVSENAKVSGTVSGNAQVSGNAKIHGLAHITGDCRVFGNAEMISGTYTTGVFTEGRHEGGDSTLTRTMKSFGL